MDFRKSLTTTRRFIRSPRVQSVGTGLAGQAFLIVSGTLVARSLGPTGRGQLAFVLVSLQIANQVGSLGLPAAATYSLASSGASNAHSLFALRRLWLFSLALATAVFLSALGIGTSWNRIHLPFDGFAWLALLPAANLSSQMAVSCLQGLHSFRRMNIARLLPSVLYALLGVLVYVCSRHPSVHLVLAGYVAFMILSAAVALRMVPISDVVPPRPTLAQRAFLKYGLAAVLGAAAPLETLSLDQAVVGAALSSRALGFYVVGASFGNLAVFVLQSLGLIEAPRVSAGGADAPAIARRAFLLGVGAAATITLVVFTLLPNLVIFFYGEQFRPSINLGRILVAAGGFLAVRRLLGILLAALGKPGAPSVVEVVSLVALVGGALTLVPVLGAAGAAWSLLVVAAIAVVALYVNFERALRGYRMPAELQPFAAVAARS